MKSFRELNIKSETRGFTGDKIKIKKILNVPISVLDFKIEDSKFDGKCLHLQIQMGETKYVVFTGSKNLMDAIGQVNKTDFPFTTTIVEDNERYQFT